MDTSIDNDMLQVSSTSDEVGDQASSHALAVVQSTTRQSSGSDSSPHAHGRVRSASSAREMGTVAVVARQSRAPSPYARNKAKPAQPLPLQAKPALLPPPAYACQVAKAVAHPLGLPVTLGPSSSAQGDAGIPASSPEIHLHRHQQLGVIVQGVDPTEHARVIADAGNVVSSMRSEAQDLLNRAEQQIAHTQHEAETTSHSV